MPAYIEKNGLWVVCACNFMEHQIRFETEDDQIRIEYHLYIQASVWGRIRQAIKHVFGHRSKYGNFSDMCLEVEEAEAIRDYLTEWIENV